MSSPDSVLGHNGLVQFDSQPRLLGHADLAVDYRESLLGESLPQRPLLYAVFEVVAVRQRGDEVQARGDVDAGLVRVVDAEAVALGRVPAHALATREAADAGDVHLHNV